MVDVVESAGAGAGADTPEDARPRRGVPSWVITVGSLVVLLGAWEIFGRDVNPVFGSYPSAIAEAAWQLARTGKLWTALLDSLRPFFLGYGLAIVIGVPVGLITGRFRTVEAAIGIYITAGYAMPLVALVPLLVLWLGLGFAVKVAVVFLMSVFPICINTWLGVTAVPKTLIEVGKSFVAQCRDPAPDHPAGDAALHHGRHPPRRRTRRGRHGDRGVLHLDLGPGRDHHHLGQQFRHRHNVCSDSCIDDNGYRTQLPDRGGRTPGRAVAGGDRRAGRIAAGRHFCRARK